MRKALPNDLLRISYQDKYIWIRLLNNLFQFIYLQKINGYHNDLLRCPCISTNTINDSCSTTNLIDDTFTHLISTIGNDESNLPLIKADNHLIRNDGIHIDTNKRNRNRFKANNTNGGHKNSTVDGTINGPHLKSIILAYNKSNRIKTARVTTDAVHNAKAYTSSNTGHHGT